MIVCHFIRLRFVISVKEYSPYSLSRKDVYYYAMITPCLRHMFPFCLFVRLFSRLG